MDDGAGGDPVDAGFAEVDVAAAGVGGGVDGLTEGDGVAAVFGPVAAGVQPQLAGAVVQDLTWTPCTSSEPIT